MSINELNNKLNKSWHESKSSASIDFINDLIELIDVVFEKNVFLKNNYSDVDTKHYTLGYILTKRHWYDPLKNNNNIARFFRIMIFKFLTDGNKDYVKKSKLYKRSETIKRILNN